ncbi:SpoIIE family protein phosphatase [Streptomyces sp. SCUT-3]|uniref:ATP-binding SpoIIE family protein phosphatase n=1 Tax=Streptomyces sp. SCUT-3 TaxID=2684469 RepID=UPI0015FE1EF5|nr:SpoIIE family protein phosphatase [Streptomyces sp. SCUT-3]QMV22682.1 SpoIIE family protein phosphatase [Streptomyces sp. SCUT-3]
MDEDAAGRPVAAASLDDQGLVLAWSEGARLMLGHSREETVGRPGAALLARPLPEVAQRSMDLGREWHGEILLRHRSGRPVPVRLRAHPLQGADGTRHWFVTADEPAPRGPSARPAPSTAAAANPSAAPGPAAAAAAAGLLGPLGARALEQLPFPVAVYDGRARLTGANEQMVHLTGMPEEAMLGLRLSEIESRSGVVELERLQEQVLRTGRTLHHRIYDRSPGETRDHAWSVFVFPVKDPDGRVQGGGVLAFDDTEQHWARRRLAVLSEAGTRIGTTLDVTRTAQELADVAVGMFADFVGVDLLEDVCRGEEPQEPQPGGQARFRRVAQQSVLPGCPEAGVPIGDFDSCPPDSPPARALATGRAARYYADDPLILRWALARAERERSIVEYGVHSGMVVPLQARGANLGFAVFLRHRTQEPFDDDDLLLAEEIAARAAVAVDNARRYTRERATAITLQRSMLPHGVPRQSAVQVASRYLPAGPRAGVGGDWFDVIPLSGARVALVVGDVVGHGLHASATMGRLRTAVRTLADVDLPPDELLTHLDDLVVRLDTEEGPEGRGEIEHPVGETGATCLYAVYDPVSRICSLARAGHPLPALVTPDGRFEYLDLPAGPPLGVGGLPFEAVEVELPEGTLLALYTDGLVENAEHDTEQGMQRLREVLSGPHRPLEQTCDTVLKALRPQRPTDDIALLLARTRALDSEHVATWDLPADPAVVADARRLVSRRLAAWELEEAAFTTELVVSELVTNAIRHASPPIQLRLIKDTTLICEVSDASSTAPHLRRARTFDEGGRGLLLVAQLTQRWGTRQTPTGKTIWAEQPLPGT